MKQKQTVIDHPPRTVHIRSSDIPESDVHKARQWEARRGEARWEARWRCGSPPHLTSPHVNSVASWEIPIHPIQICNAILTPLTNQPASKDARSINTPRLCNLEDLDDPGVRMLGRWGGRTAMKWKTGATLCGAHWESLHPSLRRIRTRASDREGMRRLDGQCNG